MTIYLTADLEMHRPALQSLVDNSDRLDVLPARYTRRDLEHVRDEVVELAGERARREQWRDAWGVSTTVLTVAVGLPVEAADFGKELVRRYGTMIELGPPPGPRRRR